MLKFARILLIGSFLSFFTAFIITGYPIFALLWNVAFPKTSAELAKILSQPITSSKNVVKTQSTFSLPEKDTTLPTEPTIFIPKIGVQTKILEAAFENYESALQLGVWRVPNFGTPTQEGPPTILVAHRFGYLNWSQQYREQNSFFNLPELGEGDTLEIIWDQRKIATTLTQPNKTVKIIQSKLSEQS